MVFINISEKNNLITLDCHKNTRDGEYFQLVIDKTTEELVGNPSPDIDKSAAYSCVLNMLETGEPLPQETVSEWG